MKWATVLVVMIGAAAAVTIYWAVGTLQRPGSPVSAAEQLEPPLAPQPKPAQQFSGPSPSVVEPLPEELEAAVAAAMTAPPDVQVTPKAPMPYPRMDQIPIGTDKDEILKAYRAPTVRSITNVHGDLLETYVYSSESTQDTWLVLRNGAVAAKFSTPHIPRQRGGRHRSGIRPHAGTPSNPRSDR